MIFDQTKNLKDICEELVCPIKNVFYNNGIKSFCHNMKNVIIPQKGDSKPLYVLFNIDYSTIYKALYHCPAIGQLYAQKMANIISAL